ACHFPGWPRWKQWLQWPRSEPGVMHLHLDDSPLREQVWRCLGHAARALQMADELALPFAANHLERALLCCQRALPADANGRVLDPRVRRALFFISEHLTDRLANADIARAAGSSPQHLCALFRDQVGKTPLQYQEELRLVQAMRLLRSTLLSIQQVATQVGFADPFYFSNRFRRRAGCSPREYRRQHDG
ncbi:MAG: helix-turn-helix domain-containing protein, partial [Puniceicoccaceae bacterium]